MPNYIVRFVNNAIRNGCPYDLTLMPSVPPIVIVMGASLNIDRGVAAFIMNGTQYWADQSLLPDEFHGRPGSARFNADHQIEVTIAAADDTTWTGTFSA